jgi:hypothetical protein
MFSGRRTRSSLNLPQKIELTVYMGVDDIVAVSDLAHCAQSAFAAKSRHFLRGVVSAPSHGLETG